MSVESHSVAVTVPGRVGTPSPGWVSSPLFDVLLLAAPWIATMPIIAITMGVDRRFGALFMLLAFPHYMSTLTFYFWDENRQRHRARWVAFFGGPVIIAFAFGALLVLNLANAMQAALLLWNAYHVARQNCGIASIYRHRSGITDPLQRNASNFAIVATSLWLAVWNVGSNTAFAPLAKLTPEYLQYLRMLPGIVAIASILALGVVLHRRIRSGGNVSLPEAIILLTSLTFFHPYLWIEDSNAATAVMLVPHYLQYLGIVWLVHRRRFGSAAKTASPPWLQRLSRNLALLLATSVSVGAMALVLQVASRKFGYDAVFQSAFIIVAFSHFYLDGLFWAFRDPTVRRTLGPYLTGWTSRG